jgi:hypothetical protein
MRYLALLLILSTPAVAELVKPDLRCGPAIPRESVTVFDASELQPDAVQEAVRQRFGELTVVRTSTVQARTAITKAWKRAEQEAAEIGCPIVVLTQHGKAFKGFGVMGGAVLPVRRDTVEAEFAKPAK